MNNDFLYMDHLSILIFAAVLPSIVLMLWIYRMDIREPEPPALLGKLFLTGCLSTVLAFLLEFLWDRYISEQMSTHASVVISMALSAGICEEFVKLFFAGKIVWRNPIFIISLMAWSTSVLCQWALQWSRM